MRLETGHAMRRYETAAVLFFRVIHRLNLCGRKGAVVDADIVADLMKISEAPSLREESFISWNG